MVTLRPVGPRTLGNRFLALWAAGWGLTGGVVAAGIHFAVPSTDLGPLLITSVLFAEVVGFTALLSARQVFPFFSRLPFPVRLGLQVVTLCSGTIFGSVAVLARCLAGAEKAGDDRRRNLMGIGRRHLKLRCILRGGRTGAPNRERDLEEFMKNKSYYMIRTRLKDEAVEAGISEAELHKLSTAAGLMARVSRTESSSSAEELNIITQALQSYWPISAEVARITAEATLTGVSLDTDPLRLAQEMLDTTTEEERTRFMDLLFAVAAADGFVSQAEMSEIGSIASWLYLPRKTFIAAKVTIPAEQRAE